MPKSKLMKSSMFRKIHSQILPTSFVAFFIVMIIAVLLTGCGAGGGGNTDSGTTDNNESNIIGSAGGTATSSDGKVKIVIPYGALNKDTEITFSAASNQPAGNIGTAYEVNPDGTTFNKPVTISIIYDEASLPSGVSESDIRLGTVTNNKWEVITDSSVNTASNTISGSISHLSTYGIVAVNTGSVPAVPTGIAATAGDGKVTISWDAVSGATSYNIYWSTASGVTKTTGTKITGAITQYTHNGRTNGAIYYYVVTAVNSYGESGESIQVSAKPEKPDTMPPDTSITDKPSSLSNLTSPSFSFSSTETGGAFQCQMDNGGYSACTSPKSYTGLTDGSHTFEVKSTDASGNTDITPANYTWVVINTFNQIGTPYQAKDGLTVKLNGLSVIKKTNSYQYLIDYTLANNTKDQAIDEGTFKMFYADKEGGQPQYGFFGRLFPGDTINKTYIFEDLKDNPFDVLEYGDNFFAMEPVANSIKWKVVTENAPVAANAGSDQTVVIESLVTLDGSGSTDADGDSLTYSWSFTSIPTNSSAVLNNPSSVKPSFVADAVGEYVLSLVVNDGKFDSIADFVTVTVATGLDGIVSSNLVLDSVNSPYLITSDIQIPYGTTMTIEPGVKIIGNNHSIKVLGTFNAAGAENSRIKLENVKIVPGSGPINEWFKISISYAEVSSGSIYPATGKAIYGSISLRNSVITDIPTMYLWYPVEDCFIEKNIFLRTGGISIGHSNNIKVYVRNNAFYQYIGDDVQKYAVENWASYNTSETIVEYNSFLNPDSVTLILSSYEKSSKIIATNNYWHTTNTAIIESMIYDRNDNIDIANYITYTPFLTVPDPNTPDTSYYIP